MTRKQTTLTGLHDALRKFAAARKYSEL